MKWEFSKLTDIYQINSLYRDLIDFTQPPYFNCTQYVEQIGKFIISFNHITDLVVALAHNLLVPICLNALTKIYNF